MPDNGSQPGYMRSDTHPGNPTAWGAAHPGQSAPTASLALITPAPASSQRVEVRPPGEQTAGPHRTLDGQSLCAFVNCKPVPEVTVNETLVQLIQEQLPWPISLWTAVRAGTYLCTTRNTHPRYLDLADDRCRAFSIVLVGDQILPADLVRAGGCAATRSRDTELPDLCGRMEEAG